MHEAGEAPELPEAVMPHLLDIFFEVGPAMPGFAGPVSISWERLKAWSDLTGYRLRAWEVRWLIRLSGAWVAEHQRAKARDAVPPFVPPIEAQRARVARQVDAYFS